MSARDHLKKAYYAYLRFLFSKTDYKFFLKASQTTVSRMVAAQIAASGAFGKVLTPISLKAPFGKRVLVLAPHQDDEAIGCGGALLLQKASGYPVKIAFIQSGIPSEITSEDERNWLRSTREKEAINAAKVGGFEDPVFLRLDTLSVATLRTVVDSIAKLIDDVKPDVIFSPFMLDPDNDHTIVNLALAIVIESIGIDCKIFGYEVWSNCIANIGVAIDSVIEGKKEMLKCYESQNSSTDYLHSTIGLNMFHSRVFGEPGSRYVEKFFEINSKEFVEPMKKIACELWPEYSSGSVAI